MCKFSSKRLLFCFKGKWWWSEGPVPRAGPRGAAGLGTLPHARCGGAHTQTWFEAHQSWIGEEYLGSTRWWKVLAPFDLGKCCLKIKKKRKKKWLVQFQNKFSQILKRKRSKKKKKKTVWEGKKGGAATRIIKAREKWLLLYLSKIKFQGTVWHSQIK